MSMRFNSDLLVVAREMRGMSQATLAQKAQITQGHLSKLENRLTEPSSDTLARLSSALDFPSSFFLQPQRIYSPVSIHRNYRKKASLSQRKLAQIHAELSIRVMNLKKLLQAVHFSPDLECRPFDIDDYEGAAERVAELVRQAWKLPRGPLGDLTDYMERAGVVIMKCDFQELEMDGITLIDPECPPCVFINQRQPPDRERFTLAHELGHILMHPFPTETMEAEANEFASAFLMPAADIKSSFAGGRVTLDLLARLKSVWRVSIQSLLVRSRSLGMITPNQYQYLWKQINFLKIRKHEPPGRNFPVEQPKALSDILKVHFDTLGYSVSELAGILHVRESDLRRIYDIYDKPTRGNLRLIS
jgi:Zn-dependent peptidase ImmA (M78 family)/plasmid maintenance system antidote protein VapI